MKLRKRETKECPTNHHLMISLPSVLRQIMNLLDLTQEQLELVLLRTEIALPLKIRINQPQTETPVYLSEAEADLTEAEVGPIVGEVGLTVAEGELAVVDKTEMEIDLMTIIMKIKEGTVTEVGEEAAFLEIKGATHPETPVETLVSLKKSHLIVEAGLVVETREEGVSVDLISKNLKKNPHPPLRVEAMTVVALVAEVVEEDPAAVPEVDLTVAPEVDLTAVVGADLAVEEADILTEIPVVAEIPEVLATSVEVEETSEEDVEEDVEEIEATSVGAEVTRTEEVPMEGEIPVTPTVTEVLATLGEEEVIPEVVVETLGEQDAITVLVGMKNLRLRTLEGNPTLPPEGGPRLLEIPARDSRAGTSQLPNPGPVVDSTTVPVLAVLVQRL